MFFILFNEDIYTYNRCNMDKYNRYIFYKKVLYNINIKDIIKKKRVVYNIYRGWGEIRNDFSLFFRTIGKKTQKVHEKDVTYFSCEIK